MRPFDSRQCKLLAARELTPGIFDFTVSCPELAAMAVPGQFAQILVPGHTLRRPISICPIGRETLRFVFQVRGGGTADLASFKPGDTIFIPAGTGSVTVRGSATVVAVGVKGE